MLQESLDQLGSLLDLTEAESKEGEEEDLEKKKVHLNKSIEELITVNQNYMEFCLENLQENFIAKCRNRFLNKTFFSLFKIENLLQLHRSLGSELESLQKNPSQISNVFRKMEPKFLIYCHLIAKQQDALDFLKEKKKTNPDVKEEVDRLIMESFSSEKNKNKEGLQDIILQISQHIMRYPLLLKTVTKACLLTKYFIFHCLIYVSDFLIYVFSESQKCE